MVLVCVVLTTPQKIHLYHSFNHVFINIQPNILYGGERGGAGAAGHRHDNCHFIARLTQKYQIKTFLKSYITKYYNQNEEVQFAIFYSVFVFVCLTSETTSVQSVLFCPFHTVVVPGVTD